MWCWRWIHLSNVVWHDYLEVYLGLISLSAIISYFWNLCHSDNLMYFLVTSNRHIYTFGRNLILDWNCAELHSGIFWFSLRRCKWSRCTRFSNIKFTGNSLDWHSWFTSLLGHSLLHWLEINRNLGTAFPLIHFLHVINHLLGVVVENFAS
jgi:hypothetical protein